MSNDKKFLKRLCILENGRSCFTSRIPRGQTRDPGIRPRNSPWHRRTENGRHLDSCPLQGSPVTSSSRIPSPRLLSPRTRALQRCLTDENRGARVSVRCSTFDQFRGLQSTDEQRREMFRDEHNLMLRTLNNGELHPDASQQRLRSSGKKSIRVQNAV